MPKPTKATMHVTAQDPEKKKPEEKPKEVFQDSASQKDKEKEGEELSEDPDLQLKNELDMLIERLKNINLVYDICTETIEVPPPHQPGLQELHEKLPVSDNKSLFADILATYFDTRCGVTPLPLAFCFTQSLCSEPRVTMDDLAIEFATFLLQHKAEPDALDLSEAKHNNLPQARLGLSTVSAMLNSSARTATRYALANPSMKQLAFILARALVPKESLDPGDGMDDGESELNVLEPKSLEDVYKSHVETARSTAAANVNVA
ncbi:hypothetical protein L227DRAFT_562140 [Lentinus tigrinus ALCF2SS1-6]|uniref:Uncharacterized protein n=1 Tax=Lentinus tigrinus ALCF2SS1-6 TaxID=1328759 RepID=A0A5C2SEF3_9APHY|nr:hypothetical protein L227DRAFT_562140 [Lentinus tigrinus ALCF2SS1-6]